MAHQTARVYHTHLNTRRETGDDCKDPYTSGIQTRVEHTPSRTKQQIAFYSGIVMGVIQFGAWVYAYALLSLALLMQLGSTAEGILL